MNRNALNGKSLRLSNTLRTLETRQSMRGTLATRRILPAALLCSSLAFIAPSAQAQEASKPTEQSGLKLAENSVTTDAVVNHGKFSTKAFLDRMQRLRLASLKTMEQTPAPAPQAAPAPAPAAPEPGTVTMTGLLDWYYSINTRAPGGSAAGQFAPNITPSGDTIRQDNFGLYFANRDRNPMLTLGELNITRTPGKGLPLGLTATLTLGDSARLFHATEPGGTNSYYPFHNLYFTATPKLFGRDVAVDFGKWASPFGIEVLESNLNDNYTRALTYWYGVPFYHLGVRATMPLTSTLTLQGALVNGWNNVADDNNAKTIYAQLTWKPSPKFTQILGWIGGLEGTGAMGVVAPTRGGGGWTINLLDFQSIYQPNEKLKLAGWIAAGNGSGNVQGIKALTGRADDHFSGNWLGMVGYARYQFTPKFAFATRLEQFEDQPGVGGLSPRFGMAGYFNIKTYSFTFEYAHKSLVTRLEYRHDSANQSAFGSARGLVTDQDTITLGQVYKF